ncbi:ash family protein [Salmonella enterica]|nr:ash family protein [Salmonella enterica]EHT2578120.1 host cell division inhibitor Icd-like protein [Salmonella enterica]
MFTLIGCVFVWIKGDFHTFIVATKNVFANRLHWLAVLSYAYPAPHKTGAGRGNPCKYKATPDAASVFFVVRYTRHSMAWCAYLMAGCSQAPDHATAHRAALIMVTLAGLPKGRPVPLYAGISTPVNVTAPIERGNSSGDSVNLYKEAVTMATTLTPSHPLFVWRFWSCQNATYTTTATSEREARLQLPAVRLVFVARIRVEGVPHV